MSDRIKVFTAIGAKCTGEYKEAYISIGEKFVFIRYTNCKEVGELTKIFKNGSILVKLLGRDKPKTDKYEPTSEGRLFLDVWKNHSIS